MSQTKEVSIPSQRCSLHIITLLKVIASLIFGFGALALVLWLAVRPHDIKVYVIAANLTQFDLRNGSSTLDYNLTLDMIVRNPNKKVSINYDRLEATASYEGMRFGWENLPPFYQGYKNTSNFRANFGGQQVMVFSESNIISFNQEKTSGFFNIDVKFSTRIRFKMGAIKTKHMKPDVDCHLRIPFTPCNATLASGFVSTRCKVDL
ncbi:NDR1/HIN1-like protein [Thalictrum thalictroides]|uniref:NDR1/HIN1-like protein n=1 Tax=Thalictrum thalictroides TaxID=46969 RepID=A0A7J6W516_THATH|nr:NDR1/HIN1-like protein [Thalictrum thalictroides]